ncbi:UNVERIFIED_CONTAM: Scarecrow-like protein 3 [Sesamum indicum]
MDIPFQFNPIVSRLENVDVESLCVKTGEAVAISSVLQLHSLLAADDEMLQRHPPSFSMSPNAEHTQRALHANPCTFTDFLGKDVISAYSASPYSTSTSPISLAATSPKMTSFLHAL